MTCAGVRLGVKENTASNSEQHKGQGSTVGTVAAETKTRVQMSNSELEELGPGPSYPDPDELPQSEAVLDRVRRFL